jgi:hypothetical protein
MLEIKDSKPDDWQSREYKVECLVVPLLIEGLSREGILDAEPELRHHEKHVLKEDIAGKVRVPSVALSAVNEEQGLKILELPNCIVSGARSLLAFFPTDSHSDVGG